MGVLLRSFSWDVGRKNQAPTPAVLTDLRVEIPKPKLVQLGEVVVSWCLERSQRPLVAFDLVE
jgi:hypothetical protein